MASGTPSHAAADAIIPRRLGFSPGVANMQACRIAHAMTLCESGASCAHAPRMCATKRSQSLLQTIDCFLPRLTKSLIICISGSAEPLSPAGRWRLPCREGGPASEGICRRTQRLHGSWCVRSQRAFSSLQRRQVAGLPFVEVGSDMHSTVISRTPPPRPPTPPLPPVYAQTTRAPYIRLQVVICTWASQSQREVCPLFSSYV